MEALMPYLYSVLFLLAAFLLMRLTLWLCDRGARRRILTYGKAAEGTVGALLMSRFGGDVILTNLYLPYRGKNGTAYTEADCIAVLRQGIVVIEVKSLVGTITNPDTDTWHQHREDPDGNVKDLDFINPILQNERHRSAIIGILEKERVLPKPSVENMVLFTSNRVSFEYVKQNEIFSLSEAMRCLISYDSGDTFTKKECREIARAIKKYAVPKRQALRLNRKKRQFP